MRRRRTRLGQFTPDVEALVEEINETFAIEKTIGEPFEPEILDSFNRTPRNEEIEPGSIVRIEMDIDPPISTESVGKLWNELKENWDKLTLNYALVSREKIVLEGKTDIKITAGDVIDAQENLFNDELERIGEGESKVFAEVLVVGPDIGAIGAIFLIGATTVGAVGIRLLSE